MVYVVVGIVVVIALVAVAAAALMSRWRTAPPAPGPIAQRLAESEPSGAAQVDQAEGR